MGHRDRVGAGPEVVADQGAGGRLSSAALRIGGGGEGDRGRRGEGAQGGREGGFCDLRGDVYTVESFDKGCRINCLIAGVRVVLGFGCGLGVEKASRHHSACQVVREITHPTARSLHLCWWDELRSREITCLTSGTQ